MLGRDQHAGETQIDQGGPDVRGHGLAAFGKGAHPGEGGDAIEDPGNRGLHQPLVGGEGEIHHAALGSRGRPSPRSAMMFFWICAVPPPMIRPRSNI